MQKNEAIADVHVGEEALAVKGTHGSDESSVLVDQTAERKLLWKIDLLILPILFLFYMLSYLDRINIGNARISGMNEELHLDVGNRFNVAIFVSTPELQCGKVKTSSSLRLVAVLRAIHPFGDTEQHLAEACPALLISTSIDVLLGYVLGKEND